MLWGPKLWVFGVPGLAPTPAWSVSNVLLCLFCCIFFRKMQLWLHTQTLISGSASQPAPLINAEVTKSVKKIMP